MSSDDDEMPFANESDDADGPSEERARGHSDQGYEDAEGVTADTDPYEADIDIWADPLGDTDVSHPDFDSDLGDLDGGNVSDGDAGNGADAGDSERDGSEGGDRG